ncbi:hypothetical protein AOC05_15595 [Arthrobacter alpinus]|uniref:Uncharacterized protein n=1 Tax=Arthrobacter alpinus TaxID=656366 RepID=A0A0M4QYG6_9MICC|nr:hypothetical protein AOC05_15595 [Arthrobacter alpinus]
MGGLDEVVVRCGVKDVAGGVRIPSSRACEDLLCLAVAGIPEVAFALRLMLLRLFVVGGGLSS